MIIGSEAWMLDRFALLCVIVFVTACTSFDPDYVHVTGVDGRGSRALVAPLETTELSLSFGQGPIASVEYRLRAERRLYLVQRFGTSADPIVGPYAFTGSREVAMGC